MFQQRQFGKFNAVKQEYGGLKYDSKLEVRYAQELDERVASGEPITWTRQRLLVLKVNGRKVCGYKMDFVVDKGNNTLELVETKGFPTPDWKIKWRLLECIVDTKEFKMTNGFHPDADLQLVLVAANAVKNWAAGIRKQRKAKKDKPVRKLPSRTFAAKRA